MLGNFDVGAIFSTTKPFESRRVKEFHAHLTMAKDFNHNSETASEREISKLSIDN